MKSYAAAENPVATAVSVISNIKYEAFPWSEAFAGIKGTPIFYFCLWLSFSNKRPDRHIEHSDRKFYLAFITKKHQFHFCFSYHPINIKVRVWN